MSLFFPQKYFINPLQEIQVTLPGYGSSSITHSNQCVKCFLCVQTSVWGFPMCAQTLMHAIAHSDCTRLMHTVREHPMKVDTGRKIPCCTEESNLHQCCSWLFSPRHYQLSDPAT